MAVIRNIAVHRKFTGPVEKKVKMVSERLARWIIQLARMVSTKTMTESQRSASLQRVTRSVERATMALESELNRMNRTIKTPNPEK